MSIRTITIIITLAMLPWIGVETTCANQTSIKNHKLHVEHGQINAFSWSKVPKDLKYVTHFVWINQLNSSNPVKVAAESRARPKGKVAVFIYKGYRNVLKNPKDNVRTPSGKLTKYKGLWFKHGIANTKKKIRDYFSKYKLAGGRMDYLVLDSEIGRSMWHLNQNEIKIISHDPRFISTVAPMLAKQGMTALQLPKVRNYVSTLPHYQLGKDNLGDILLRNTPPYIAWNAVAGKIVTQALNKAIFDPIHKLYPNVQASDYNRYIITKRNVIPDYNGHLQYYLDYFGNHGSRSFYESIGQLSSVPGPNGKPYGKKPFDILRWEVNVMRSIMRSSNVPFQPWIPSPDYGNNKFRKGPYFWEVVYHLALSGASDFLYWNASDKSDVPSRKLNHALEVLNKYFGNKPRQCVTPNNIKWDSKLIVSGMKIANNKMLWRITVPPGTKAIHVLPANKTIQLHNQIGTWYESKLGQEVHFAIK